MSKVAEDMKHYKVVITSTNLVSEAEKALGERGYVVSSGRVGSRFAILNVMGLEPVEVHFDVDVLCKSVEENEEIITYLW